VIRESSLGLSFAATVSFRRVCEFSAEYRIKMNSSALLKPFVFRTVLFSLHSSFLSISVQARIKFGADTKIRRARRPVFLKK